MKILHTVTWILIIVGALNWGLFGAFDFNLVMKIFANWPIVEKIIYVLVGLSAIYELVSHKNTCKMCGKDAMMQKPAM